jgi:proteasome accessory factor A
MRERVFGIETEYALIYHPGRGEIRRPSNLQLYGLFEQALRQRLRGLPRTLSVLRSKTGLFLENGASFHYEATPESFEHGLLEVASPECRDPLTLLHHERAKDDLVEELCAHVNRQLRQAGFRGEARVGKNNVDSQGHTFGSHENYWVEDPLPPGRRRLLLLVWIPLWLVTLPVLLWVVLLTPALFGIGIGVALLLGALGIALNVLATLLRPLRRSWSDATTRFTRRATAYVSVRARAVARNPGELVRRLNRLVAPLFPILELHSWLLQRFILRRIQRFFTAFLVTRTVFTGAGSIVFDGGPLVRLAQRPPFLQALARIFTSGERRPIYEIRDLFFQPLELFRSQRRLHLMLGDANLCEWAQVLRVGVSALVLEALEEGDSGSGPEPWPELADPLAALRTLNRDPDLQARLELADGSHATALEIQTLYLEGVRETLGGSLQGWKARVLRDWETTLDLLARDPSQLADRVDWIAKQSLFRREIPDPEDREALRQRGGALIEGPPPEDDESRRLRDLAFRARRLDLRYHELGSRGGYRKLVRDGSVRALAERSAVHAARTSPPEDTRARARGRAIRDACVRRRSGAATWHRVRIGVFEWRWFPDPLDPGLEGLEGEEGVE